MEFKVFIKNKIKYNEHFEILFQNFIDYDFLTQILAAGMSLNCIIKHSSLGKQIAAIY